MMRRIVPGCLLALAVVALICVGCSSKSTNDGIVYGDPDTPAFQSMRAAIATAIDSTLAVGFNVAFNPYRFPTEDYWDRPELSPSDSVLYNYVNSWHVLYVGSAAAGNYSATYVDSIRFWEGSTAVRFFNPQRSTAIDLIHHQSSQYSGTGQDYTDLAVYLTVQYTNWNQADRQFEGTARVTLDDYKLEGGQQVNETYNFAAMIKDLVYSEPSNFQWWGIKPIGGSIHFDGTLDKSGQRQVWEVDVTFNSDGTANIRAQNGNTIFQYGMTPSYN